MKKDMFEKNDAQMTMRKLKLKQISFMFCILDLLIFDT